MANLKYRITMTPEVRTVSEIKGAPLTNIEVDSNFKLLDTAISDVRNELLSDVADVISGVGDASLIDAGAINSSKLANSGVTAGTVGSATQIPVVTFNAKGQATGYTTATPQTDWSNVLSKPANISDIAALSSVEAIESIANLVTAADKMIYTTASNVYAATNLTAFARTVLAAETAEDARVALGANDASVLTTGTLATARMPVGSVVKSKFVETTTPAGVVDLQSLSHQPLISTTFTNTRTGNAVRIRAHFHFQASGNVTVNFRDGATVIKSVSSFTGVANTAPTYFELEYSPGSVAEKTYNFTISAADGAPSFVTLDSQSRRTITIEEIQV